MSLTAFQRVRRMKQVEEMKPENIKVEEKPVVTEQIIEPKEVKVEEPVEEKTETTTTSRRRTRRN